MPLPDLIPVADLLSPPTRAAASISPDGTRIAFLAPWKNRLNVWIEDLDSDSASPRCVTADANRSVLHYEWTDDPRWLIYLQDNDGDENWHIHRVDLDHPDSPSVDLTPFPGVMALPIREVTGGATTVMLNSRDVTLLDAYELDIATGQLTLIAENPGHVNGWLGNDRGDLLAVAATGAYCYTMANNYNTALRPPVVFCRDGVARLAVRRETLDDLLRREQLLPPQAPE